MDEILLTENNKIQKRSNLKRSSLLYKTEYSSGVKNSTKPEILPSKNEATEIHVSEIINNSHYLLVTRQVLARTALVVTN